MSAAADAEAYASESLRIFGRNFRRIRQDAECSQADIAERHAINRKLISAVERGEGNPSLLVLCRLALAAGRELPAMLDKARAGRQSVKRARAVLITPPNALASKRKGSSDAVEQFT